MAKEGEWFLLIDDRAVGPWTQAEMRRRAAARTLLGTDLVPNDGASWTPAERMEGLSDLYEPPLSLAYHGETQASAALSPYATKMLRQTAPWTLTAALALFVLAGVIGMWALILMFFSLQTRGAPGFIPAAILLFLAAILAVCGIFAVRYWRALRRLVAGGGGDSALEDALEAQKSFWKFIAVSLPVLLVILLVMTLIFLVEATLLWRGI